MNIRSKKGFTLMEMLIVVAIIAILVAIAIPVFSAQLNNAKDAVIDANMRSAESMAMVKFLSETTGETDYSTEQEYVYTCTYADATHTLSIGNAYENEKTEPAEGNTTLYKVGITNGEITWTAHPAKSK